MYKREFENNLSRNYIPKSLLLYGQSDFFITYFGGIVAKIWQDDALTFYFDAYDFPTVKRHLNQSSLFNDKNIAIIKTDKAIPKKELDVLVDICFKSERSFLLVEYFGEDKKGANLAKAFSKKKNADFVRFFKPNMGEAMNILNQKSREIGLNIQSYALNHLYQIHNENLSLAVNELDKLLILNKEVKKEDIDREVFGLGDVNLEDFIVKIIEKKDIKEDFVSLSEGGQYDEIRIINSIQNYISQLFAFNTYIKIHGNFNAKDILGYNMPDFVAQKRAQQCMRFELETFSAILNALCDAEYTLKKSAFSEKNSYLLSTLLKVQSLV